MESADDLLTETIFERLETRGVQSAFLCVKKKLVQLLGRGATVAVAAENPPRWLIEEVGPVPSVYSAEINLWIFEALVKVILRFPRLEFVYLATTDYIPHRHAAEETASQEYLSGIDDKLKVFLERHPEAKVGITADHGMTHKKHGINPACSLVRIGQNAVVIPIIRDRYTIHHSNLSGAAYIYLEQPQALEEARSLLGEVPGIEIALTRTQAVEKFRLYSDRIGDLMVVGDRETVFGELPTEHTEVNVRSHGSHHERSVPIISYGIKHSEAPYEYNKDLIRFLYREETDSV